MDKEEAFIKDCCDGNLNGIANFINENMAKSFLTKIRHIFSDRFSTTIMRGLYSACENEALPTLRYLLENEAVVNQCRIDKYIDSLLSEVVMTGNIGMVRYMLTSSQPLVHPNLDKCGAQALKFACNMGYLNIVQYLTSAHELKNHGISWVDVNSGQENFLVAACQCEHKDVINYLLKSPLLAKPFDIHANNDLAFEVACKMSVDLAEHFIFELNIEKTSDIENFLKNPYPSPNRFPQKLLACSPQEIENKFLLRDWAVGMTQSVISNAKQVAKHHKP